MDRSEFGRVAPGVAELVARQSASPLRLGAPSPPSLLSLVPPVKGHTPTSPPAHDNEASTSGLVDLEPRTTGPLSLADCDVESLGSSGDFTDRSPHDAFNAPMFGALVESAVVSPLNALSSAAASVASAERASFRRTVGLSARSRRSSHSSKHRGSTRGDGFVAHGDTPTSFRATPLMATLSPPGASELTVPLPVSSSQPFLPSCPPMPSGRGRGRNHSTTSSAASPSRAAPCARLMMTRLMDPSPVESPSAAAGGPQHHVTSLQPVLLGAPLQLPRSDEDSLSGTLSGTRSEPHVLESAPDETTLPISTHQIPKGPRADDGGLSAGEAPHRPLLLPPALLTMMQDAQRTGTAATLNAENGNGSSLPESAMTTMPFDRGPRELTPSPPQAREANGAPTSSCRSSARSAPSDEGSHGADSARGMVSRLRRRIRSVHLTADVLHRKDSAEWV